MTQTPTTPDADPVGELADAQRLLKAPCKLVEHMVEDENQDAAEPFSACSMPSPPRSTRWKRCLRRIPQNNFTAKKLRAVASSGDPPVNAGEAHVMCLTKWPILASLAEINCVSVKRPSMYRTVKEFADALNVAPKIARNPINQRRIAFVPLGEKKVMIADEAIREFIQMKR
jgi:hypothetical protein